MVERGIVGLLICEYYGECGIVTENSVEQALSWHLFQGAYIQSVYIFQFYAQGISAYSIHVISILGVLWLALKTNAQKKSLSRSPTTLNSVMQSSKPPSHKSNWFVYASSSFFVHKSINPPKHPVPKPPGSPRTLPGYGPPTSQIRIEFLQTKTPHLG